MDEPRREGAHERVGSWPRGVARWSALTAGALGLYLSIAAELSLAEIVVGAVVASLAGTAAYAVIAEERVQLRPSLAELAQVRTLPRAIVVESWGVFVTLARHLFTERKARSLLISAPFEYGEQRDPRASTRRALALAITSAAPRAFVVDFDPSTDTISYHLLELGPVPTAIEALRGDA